MMTAELMFGCQRRIHKLLDTHLSGCGLSLSRAKILFRLEREGPQNQSALANAFGLAPRTVTELVDTLERGGLVERRPDPTDRRARLVQLTEAGEQAQSRAMLIRDQVVDKVLGSLSTEQRTALNTAFQAMGAELDRIDADGGVIGDVAGSCIP